MASMRSARLALAVSLLLVTVVHARWVVFGEVLVSQTNTVDTPTTYLVIQEQTAEEQQPIAILDAWETVDDSMEGFWNSLLLPRMTPVMSNPFSWVYQQLQAVDDFHRAAFSDLASGSSSSSSSRGREAEQVESPDVASVEQMLRNVGCNRFRPAMQDYEQQQNLFSRESESQSDLFLSTMLAARSTDYADQDYLEAEDYAEDYIGDYDALRSAGDYRSGRVSNIAAAVREWFPSADDSAASGEVSRLRGGDNVGRSVAQRSASSFSEAASMGELADSILSMLGGGGRASASASSFAESGRIQETTLGRVVSDALQVEYLGAEDDALNRAERNAFNFHQGGVERTATQVAPTDDDEQQQQQQQQQQQSSSSFSSSSASSNTISASLAWTREGGLVLEAESRPQSDGGASDAADSVLDAAMELAQYVGQLQQQQGQGVEAEERTADHRAEASASRRRDEQQVNAAAEVSPRQVLVSDILLREAAQQEQREAAALSEGGAAGVSLADDTASAEPSVEQGVAATSSSSFAVSWTRDGGLMIETYEQTPEDAYDDVEAAEPNYSDAAGARAFLDDEGWPNSGAEGLVYVNDDLEWNWTDEEGNLNWGLMLLTLLVVASSVVAVAAVQSYLALHGAVCAAACRAANGAGCGNGGGKRAARRLSEPLLVQSEDEESAAEASGDERRYVVPHLVATRAFGAGEVVAQVPTTQVDAEVAASYAVEYAALYAQAQGRGRQ